MQYVFLIRSSAVVKNTSLGSASWRITLTTGARAYQKHVLHGPETVSIFVSKRLNKLIYHTPNHSSCHCLQPWNVELRDVRWRHKHTTPAGKNFKVCIRCSAAREILRAAAVEILHVTAHFFRALLPPAKLQPTRDVASVHDRDSSFTLDKSFLSRDAMHKRGLCRHALSVCPSVCLSVCHIRGFCRNEWTYLQNIFHNRVATPL